MKRATIAAVLTTMSAAGMVSAVSMHAGQASAATAQESVTVGSANFPEAVLLGEIYAQALEGRGVKVSRKLNIGNREVYYAAMTKGDVQLMPEYTNSLLSFVLKQKKQSPTAKNIAQQVAALKANLPSDLTVLNASTAEDKDVIVCNAQTAKQYNVQTLRGLASVSKNIVLGGPPEFAKRSPFGIPGFKQFLGAEFKEFKPLDVAGPLTVDALKSNAVNCANLFSTQSAILVNGFVPLRDTTGLVPAEAVLPFLAKEKATPTVTAALNAASRALDTTKLAAMVKKVEVDKIAPAVVAKEFLTGAKLIK